MVNETGRAEAGLWESLLLLRDTTFDFVFLKKLISFIITKVLTMFQIYHTSILHSTALFHPPLLIPGTVSTGIIFALTYMCVHYLRHIHPPTPFPNTSLLSPVSRTHPHSRQNLFHPTVL
jgi:hypothetical protein